MTYRRVGKRLRAVHLIGLSLTLGSGVVRAEQVTPDRAWIDAARGSAASARPPRRDLPYARGRAFRTLDAYLAYLQAYAAPIDRPWYREVRPGLYRLETGNLRTGIRPRLFTRDELERRFGFGG